MTHRTMSERSYHTALEVLLLFNHLTFSKIQFTLVFYYGLLVYI